MPASINALKKQLLFQIKITIKKTKIKKLIKISTMPL
jgi:hypothetical protein